VQFVVTIEPASHYFQIIARLQFLQFADQCVIEPIQEKLQPINKSWYNFYLRLTKLIYVETLKSKSL